MTDESVLAGCRQAPGGPHQPPVYMDLASLGALPRYTCGQLYYYPAFNARRDQVRLPNHGLHKGARLKWIT